MNQESIYQHLAELKKRLLYSLLFFAVGFAAAYFFAVDIYQLLAAPLGDQKMIFTGLTEVFFTYISLAVYIALAVSFPFIASQIYMFLAPALYKTERKFLVPFFFISPLLFLAGAALVYFFVMPLAWQFFLSFQTEQIELQARVSEYLSLSLQLIVGFGIAFQLPLVLMLLVKMGVLSVSDLKKSRKIAIVIMFVIAAILTPPDALSQIIMAVILCALYELAIIFSRNAREK